MAMHALLMGHLSAIPKHSTCNTMLSLQTAGQSVHAQGQISHIVASQVMGLGTMSPWDPQNVSEREPIDVEKGGEWCKTQSMPNNHQINAISETLSGVARRGYKERTRPGSVQQSRRK